MLTGIHILLTYKCTWECDHCFLHCSPRREGTFTLAQLRELLHEIGKIGTIKEVYFEGGEPFLFYPLMLEGVRMARAAGLDAGFVTNAFWATSIEDAVHWLRPLAALGVADLSISDDEFHRSDSLPERGEFAYQAAKQLGIPCSKICIEPPRVDQHPDEKLKGKPVVGGGVRFKGRAAEKLTAGLPLRPLNELTTCPHEDLLNPERVHVDAFGNVHLCQGLSLGNMWQTPLSELVRAYDGNRHPVAGPLRRGGPARLVEETGLKMDAAWVDECHLCYYARKALLSRFPELLGPPQVFGVEPSQDSG